MRTFGTIKRRPDERRTEMTQSWTLIRQDRLLRKPSPGIAICAKFCPARSRVRIACFVIGWLALATDDGRLADPSHADSPKLILVKMAGQRGQTQPVGEQADTCLQ